MSALIDERHVAVTPTLIATFGPVCAIVLQEIHFTSALDGYRGAAGECADAQDGIARRTGLNLDQVRKALARLVKIGAVRSVPDPSDGRRRVYAIVSEAIPPAGYRPDRSRPIGMDADIDADRHGYQCQTASIAPECSSIEELNQEVIPSPTPPEPEGEEPEVAAPQLFVAGGATARSERNPTASTDKAIAALFEVWWPKYPSGAHRGPAASALRAFRKAIKAGASIRELEIQLAHYVAARALYRGIWSVEPTLMLGSSFLNGKRELWADEWGEAELTYWPAPVGQEWGAPRILGRDEALRLAEAAWLAEHPEEMANVG